MSSAKIDHAPYVDIATKHKAEAEAEVAGWNRRKYSAVVLSATFTFCALALTAPFVFLKTPLPYMATPSRKLRKALHFLRVGHSTGTGIGQVGLPFKPADTFVDLGSGDGEAVLQAARLGFHKCTGVELNTTLWLISQFRIWTQLSSSQRRNAGVNVKLGDMFQQPLQDADAVMIFGVTPLMHQISRKLRQELRPGAHVLAYRFPLPLRQPLPPPCPLNTAPQAQAATQVQGQEKGQGQGQEQEKGPAPDLLLDAVLIYDEEEFRIYQVR